MSYKQIEELLRDYDTPPEQLLEKIFDIDAMCTPKGFARVSVTYREKNGSRRGSYDVVRRDQLKDRQYIVSHLTVPNALEIEFTDIVWDKRMYNCGIDETYKIYSDYVVPYSEARKLPCFGAGQSFCIYRTDTNKICETGSLQGCREALRTYRNQESVMTRLENKSVYKIYRVEEYKWT